jgi:YfiH family protein
MNLGDHVEDQITDVESNRRRLQEVLRLPTAPSWLQQVHGVNVVDLDAADSSGLIVADASICRSQKHICAVMTADCLPVLFCDRSGTSVAAAHAGWRGLCGGVLEATVQNMRTPARQVMAWLGPAIGPKCFEVGNDVRDAFLAVDANDATGFTATQNGRWLADIYHLARLRLLRIGVEQIYGGGYCTYSDDQRFYSYRREQRTGRMVSLIWLGDVTTATSAD